MRNQKKSLGFDRNKRKSGKIPGYKLVSSKIGRCCLKNGFILYELHTIHKGCYQQKEARPPTKLAWTLTFFSLLQKDQKLSKTPSFSISQFMLYFIVFGLRYMTSSSWNSMPPSAFLSPSDQRLNMKEAIRRIEEVQV